MCTSSVSIETPRSPSRDCLALTSAESAASRLATSCSSARVSPTGFSCSSSSSTMGSARFFWAVRLPGRGSISGSTERRRELARTTRGGRAFPFVDTSAPTSAVPSILRVLLIGFVFARATACWGSTSRLEFRRRFRNGAELSSGVPGKTPFR